MATCQNCGGTWYPASYSSPAEPCDCTEDNNDKPTTKDEAVDSGSSDDPRFAGDGPVEYRKAVR